MARFEGMTSGAAPLQLQLSTTATGAGSVALVVGLKAEGENATGSASHPVVTRPAVIGAGTPATADVRSSPSSAGLNACTFLNTFSSAPSTPSVSSGAFNLPHRVSWMADPKEAIVVGGQGAIAALLLYATASAGHLWSGAIVWEEL